MRETLNNRRINKKYKKWKIHKNKIFKESASLLKKAKISRKNRERGDGKIQTIQDLKI